MAENGQQSTETYQDILKVFRIVAPEFASIPDEDTASEDGGSVTGVKTYIELFADQVSCRRFGKSYAKAVAYLVAHKMKMLGLAPDTDGLGSLELGLRIGSASEGETSVSFNTGRVTSGDADADYNLTFYGMEFLKLRRGAIIPIVSAGEPVPNLGMQYGHEPWCPNSEG